MDELFKSPDRDQRGDAFRGRPRKTAEPWHDWIRVSDGGGRSRFVGSDATFVLGVRFRIPTESDVTKWGTLSRVYFGLITLYYTNS